MPDEPPPEKPIRRRSHVRVMFTAPEDERGMVVVVLPEGTEVLDTSDKLYAKILTEPWTIKLPKEILYRPPGEWEELLVEGED